MPRGSGTVSFKDLEKAMQDKAGSLPQEHPEVTGQSEAPSGSQTAEDAELASGNEPSIPQAMRGLQQQSVTETPDQRDPFHGRPARK